jgi:MFS family permease
VLPVLARTAGLSASELGLVTGASAFARILSNVPAAMLAERVGRRPLLVVGPAIGAVGMLVFAYSNSFPEFVLANTLAGVGGACTTAGAGLYLADISTPLNRARTMAPLMVTALLGFAVGPALGGIVAENYGLHAPFLITAGGMFAGSASAYVFLPETLKRMSSSVGAGSAGAGPELGSADTTSGNRTHTSGDDLSGEGAVVEPTALEQWQAMMRQPALQGINAVVFMTGFSQGAGPVTGILYATEHLGMSTGEVGFMFTACVLAMAAVVQPATGMSDRVKDRSSIMWPGLLVGSACFAAQSQCLSMWPYVGFAVLRALADAACVMPNVTPYIIDHTAEEQRAQALAMRNMVQDVGMLVGAAGMGLVTQVYGVQTAMLATGALQACAATVLFVRRRPPPRHQAEVEVAAAAAKLKGEKRETEDEREREGEGGRGRGHATPPPEHGGHGG